jgi:hypothetical protein
MFNYDFTDINLNDDPMDEFVDKKKEEYQKQNLCLNQNDSSSIP